MLKPYSKAEVTFDLIEELGHQGQNSKTYRAYDHQLDAEIVIKQLTKAKLASPANFFDESKALYTSSHPNVVQIQYACEDVDFIYLAMPFYSQGSVKSLITGQNLTVREIVTIGCQALSGLHNIHSKKLIHFDIKPDNILLTDRREALVSDFGLAKQTTYGVALQDRMYGKMIPPEGLKTDTFDLRFDIYQLGLTLYRMCNGDEEFYDQYGKFCPNGNLDRNAFRAAVLAGTFPDRKKFPPHVPQRLRKVVRKCMETDPSNRFASAIEVANALAAVDGTTLDWRLARGPGQRTWTKTEGDNLYELVVPDGANSVCRKSVAGGQPRKVGDGCLITPSEKDLEKFMGAY